MGAVDKNMRKELSLEIDGHACPDQYVNVGIGVEIKFRAPHAIDAMLIPWPRRLDGVHATHWLIPAQDFTPLEFEEIVDLFKEFDKDKSGYIDEEELCEMMRALEMDHSLAKAKEMMLEIVLTQRLFLNFKLASMASARCHDASTPSTGPSESLRGFATASFPRRTKMVVESWNSASSVRSSRRSREVTSGICTASLN